MATDASFDCVDGLLNPWTPGHPVIGHSIQNAAATTNQHGAPYVIAVAIVLCGRAKDGHSVIFGRLV